MRFAHSVLLVVVLAGCAAPAGQQAQSSSSAAPTSKTVWKGTSVKEPPAVTSPALDVNAFEKDVCEVIDRDWLEDFGVSRLGTMGSSAYGPRCEWDALDHQRGIAIGVILRGRHGGLDSVYLNESSFKYFRPGMVAEYPSVEATFKEWPEATCATHVGTAERQGFEAIVTMLDPEPDEYTNPCTAANQVAAAVVERLKRAK